jgi:hypothetical protein
MAACLQLARLFVVVARWRKYMILFLLLLEFLVLRWSSRKKGQYFGDPKSSKLLYIPLLVRSILNHLTRTRILGDKSELSKQEVGPHMPLLSFYSENNFSC